MSKTNIHINRVAGFCSAIVLIVLLVIVNITIASGLIPGLSPEIDESQSQLIRRESMNVCVEGQFVDRNGQAITLPGGPGQIAQIIEDECYSFLIGYRTTTKKLSGLRKQLLTYLYFGGEDGVGAQVSLTTDNGLQAFCYEALGQKEGSVIVMDANTGELLAITSRSSAELGYDADQYQQRYDEYTSANEAFWYDRCVFCEDPPGSTFKIVTAAALLENGMGDYVYDDLSGAYEVPNGAIHNVNNRIYGAGVTLEKGLNKSVNVYFASAAVELGAHRIMKTMNSLRFDEDIVTDFCRIKSPFSMSDVNTKAELAQAGYGQGRLTMSPLHISMIMGAVMNDGVMVTPYVINQILDDGADRTGEIHPKGQAGGSTQAFSSDTAGTLKKYLHSTAVGYGFTEDRYGMVYAKTGTADQHNGKNHVYMLVGLETQQRDYAILIDARNVDQTSSSLKSSAFSIVEYILSM